MLSCRTGRGTSKDSPPEADLDHGAAGAARSVAGCFWPAPTVAARRRRRRAHRIASPGHPTRPEGPCWTGHGLRGLAVLGVRCRTPCGQRGQVSARSRAYVRMLWTGAVVHRNRLRRSAPMLAPASADWRTTGGTPGQQGDLRWFSSPCGHTGPPAVVGLPENGFRSAGGEGRSATASRRTTGHRPETNRRRSRETAYPDGAEPSRSTGGCPPAVPAPTPGVGR